MKPEDTLAYYNQNADAYVQQTAGVNMSDLYDKFIHNLPFHLGIPQHILDVGCGSGRDAFWFSNRLAMNVTAIDGSSELIKINKRNYEFSEVKWLNLLFDEIKIQGWENQFTGIWACASLLHVPFNELPNIIVSLLDILVSGGVMYASFKHGTSVRMYGERFFCDMNEDRLLDVLHQNGMDYTVEYECWLTTDKREDRDDGWFNVLITKKV